MYYWCSAEFYGTFASIASHMQTASTTVRYITNY